MTNTQDLNRRLSSAIAEAKDADRVWQLAMASAVEARSDDHPEGRRRLDALWQERERAHARVLELRWLMHRRLQRRPEGFRSRLRGVRRTIAVLGYSATRRAL